MENRMRELRTDAPLANARRPRAPRRRNAPLAPLEEKFRGRPVYSNGEKAFFAHASPERDGRFTLQLIQLTENASEPYVVLARVRVEPGRLHIEDVQNVYPGSVPDLIPVHLPPQPEWKGLGFMRVIMSQLRKIAEGRGVRVITLVPDVKEHREYYSRLGFAQDPLNRDRMQFVF
ncbi:MAG TPA: hypothetical protein PKJ97_00090 [Candidatus Bilamarchaeaceae archaeon]|nr:hypothetical protein [Candidatus Bilamarchaeaceae archaeon]